MGRKNTKATDGPTLFEAETFLKNADRFDEKYNELLGQRERNEQTGNYSPFVTDELKATAKTTYCNNAEQLRDCLTASGATPELIDVVLTDYAALLCGDCDVVATPQQMIDAVKAVKPIQAFLIDRYTVHYGLFTHYLGCIDTYNRYNTEVKGETATPESKKRFMDGFDLPGNAITVCWLFRSGISEINDWRGLEPAKVAAWIAEKKDLAGINKYLLFYLIAKCVYNATPRELERIAPPPVHAQGPMFVFAESYTEETKKFLNRAAKRFSEVAEVETKAEQEKAVQAAKDWQDDTNAKILELHETPNIILSRPVEISPNGAEIINTIPVQKYIDSFTAKNPDKFGVITQMTVQKVFEAACNLLPNFCTTIESGKFIYKTTISKFAEICGYADANQSQKLALLGGLRVLSNLYVIVDRPVKVTTVECKNGRKRRVTSGGKTAVQVLNVPEFELENEGIIISISPEAMKGKPILITAEMFRRLRAETKSLPQSRLMYQILGKGHKTESDLIKETYGYNDKLKLVQDNPEETKKVKDEIRKHKSRDKKDSEEWIKKVQDKGLITYSKRKGKGDNVYSWEMPKPVGLNDCGTPQEPEEQ